MLSDSRHTIDDRLVGTVIGRYRVKQVLDRGGMGAVYLAEHLLIDKPVVIKLLRPDLSHHEEMVGRFFNEAKAASAIRHPGVIEVFDFGYHADGRAYIVMEHLDGHSLAHRLAQRGRIAEAEAVAIARSIASVLAAAHARGIVHRDLKPDNVFLVPDPDTAAGERVKVLDFGIAKLDDGRDTTRTRTGAVMGTPLYMAPEQARGAGAVDARADLYSLGCLLYHMLCGRPPFLAEGEGEIIAMQLYAEPLPPRALTPALSDAIEQITLRLLAKEPDQRPASARDVVRELGGISPTVSAAAPPVDVGGRTLDGWFDDVDAPPRPQLEIIDDTIPPLPRSRARWILPALGVIALGVAGGYAIVRRMGVEPIGDGAPARPMAAVVPAHATAPVAPPAPAPPAPAPVPPAPDTITLTVETEPADAAITLDGAPQDRGGGALVIPRDGGTHTLAASAPGYGAAQKTFTADHDGALSIVLAREPAARRAAPPVHQHHAVPAANRRPAPTPSPTTSPNGSPIETDL